MDNSFFTSFPNVLISTQEANELIERIDTVLAELYRIDPQRMLHILAENMHAPIVNALEYTLSQDTIKTSNQQVIKTFLQRLQGTIRSCEVLSMTIAFPPTQAFLTHIGAYAKQLFGASTILEITVDPSVLACGIFIYKGRYLDRSVKKKLEEYFTFKKVSRS